MYIWQSDEEYGEWLDSVITFYKRMISIDDKAHIHHKKSIEDYKKRLKSEQVDAHPSEWVIELLYNQIKHHEEMLEMHKKQLQKNREMFTSFQESKKEHLERAITKKSIPKGNIILANKNRFSVIKGGLYKPSTTPAYLADDLISDEFKAWQRDQKAKDKLHT